MYECSIGPREEPQGLYHGKLKSPTVRAIVAMFIECRWYCNALRSVSAGPSSLRRMIYCAGVSGVYFGLGASHALRAGDGNTHTHACIVIFRYSHTRKEQLQCKCSHMKILVSRINCKIPNSDLIKGARARERRQRQRKKNTVPPSASKLKCKCFFFFFFVIIICLILFIPHATPTPFALHPRRPPPSSPPSFCLKISEAECSGG